MKSLKHCLSLFTLLFLTVSIHAQTAEEIIAKHIDAIGGKQKLSGLSSIRAENSLDVAGTTAVASIVVLNGKGYRNESDIAGQKVIQVYTDKSGWALNPFMGVNEPQPMPDQQFKAGQEQIYIIPLIDYAARGGKAELIGQEKVGNVNAYKIKLTNSSNNVTTYYFDPTTYYILQSVNSMDFGGQTMDMKVNFSDFRKTDYGLVMPYTTDIDFGGQFSMTSKLTKIEFNGTVDTAIFEMKK